MLFLLLSASAFASQCPSFHCELSFSTSGTCEVFSNTKSGDIYKITQCAEGLICDFDLGQNTDCSYPAAYSRFPGDYCSSILDCMSNVCMNSICVGLHAGAACTEHSHCAPGTFCSISASPSTCSLQLLSGKACTADEECQNNAVCDGGLCIVMFSYATGQSITIIWRSGLAPPCATRFVSSSTSGFTCAPAPTRSKHDCRLEEPVHC